MSFVVTYRNEAGIRTEIQIEADDRKALWPILSARGITALSVREGTLRNGAAKSHGTNRPNGKFFLAIVLLGMVFAAGIWSLTLRTNLSPITKAAKKASKSLPFDVAKPAKKTPTKVALAESISVVSSEDEQKKAMDEAVRLVKKVRTPNVLDLTTRIESNKVGEVRLVRYTNPLHQELAKYTRAGSDCDTPDPIDDEEALKLCDEKVVYNFDDSDDVLEEKKAIEEIAAELKRYLLNGGHAERFFINLMERQDQEAEIVREAQETVEEICKDGDEASAEAARKQCNELLSKQGLPEIQNSEYLKSLVEEGKRGGVQ